MDLDVTDAQGLTPLHLAVSVAPLKVVSQLLEAGQDVNAQAGRAQRSGIGTVSAVACTRIGLAKLNCLLHLVSQGCAATSSRVQCRTSPSWWRAFKSAPANASQHKHMQGVVAAPHCMLLRAEARRTSWRPCCVQAATFIYKMLRGLPRCRHGLLSFRPGLIP